MSTGTCARTVNPHWMEEFIVSWRTNRHWIRFDVVDRVRILPDKPLGTCFFDVSQLKWGETQEVWLPLFDTKVATRLESPAVTVWSNMSASTSAYSSISETSSTPNTSFDSSAGAGMVEPTPTSVPEASVKLPPSEWGHLHVIIDLRPFPESPRCSLMELPKVRLVLEKPFYRPGDIVRGMVFYNITAKTFFKSFSVYLHGESHVKWVEAGTDNHYFDATHPIIKDTHAILSPSSDSKGIYLEYQHICAAFEFHLPLGLPSSSSPASANNAVTTTTAYKIGAKALLDTLSMEDAHIPLVILSHYQPTALLPDASIPPQPIFVPDTTPLRYSIIVPRVHTPGSTISATVTVDNTKGTKSITQLTFGIYELKFAFARHILNWHWKRYPFCLMSLDLCEPGVKKKHAHPNNALPILPGEARKFAVTMVIPKTASNSVLPAESQLYTIQHAFTVSTHEFFAPGVVDDMGFTPIIIASGGLPENCQSKGAASTSSDQPNPATVNTATDPPAAPLRPYLDTARYRESGPGPQYDAKTAAFRFHVFPLNSPLTHSWLPIGPWTGAKHPDTAISIYSMPPNEVSGNFGAAI